jgi:serine/threonine-protein kinase RsbW
MQYKYRVSCQKNRLRKVRDFIGKTLEKHLHSEEEIHFLVLAVDEICANLMVHSHNCNPKEYLDLNVSISNNHIIFEIRDTGSTFNIIDYKEPSLEKLIAEGRQGGLGLNLVKKIIDKIEIDKEQNYTVYKLYKSLNHTPH